MIGVLEVTIINSIGSQISYNLYNQTKNKRDSVCTIHFKLKHPVSVNDRALQWKEVFECGFLYSKG